MKSFSGNIQIPFRSESTLRTELRDVYLAEALIWITSSRADNVEQSVLRPVSNDNPWETAYAILVILRAKEYLNDVSTYKPQYDQKVEHAVDYLISKVQGDEEQISIDRNPYDTSLTLQAFLLFQTKFPQSRVSEKLTENKIIERSLSWIVNYSQAWLTNRTIGELDDVAQAMIAILLAYELIPEHESLKNPALTRLIRSIVDEVIGLGEADGKEIFWENVYVSAYVLIALIKYVDTVPSKETKEGIIESILLGTVGLERRLSKSGDQPPDTALALQLYIMVG